MDSGDVGAAASTLPRGNRPTRAQRVARYKLWSLQKRLAELSAQVEAAVIEARQLLAWKQQAQQRASAVELSKEEKRVVEANRRARLLEVVQKHCSAALKAIMQHKWAFPFMAPVDVERFPDYPRVVAVPMDLSTIKARLEAGAYKDPRDWMADLCLMLTNAKKFNPPGSDCYLMAQTLQEFVEEKYDKAIAPRLAEEAVAAARDEAALRKRRLEVAAQQQAEAQEAAASTLLGLVAELHAALRDAKSMAASLCEPLTLEEKNTLASTIRGLPKAQMEAIVAFIASRHPPALSPGDVPSSQKVQLHLGKYDALLLRQLQHLVASCTGEQERQRSQQQQSQAQQLLPAAGAAAASNAAPDAGPTAAPVQHGSAPAQLAGGPGSGANAPPAAAGADAAAVVAAATAAVAAAAATVQQLAAAMETSPASSPAAASPPGSAPQQQQLPQQTSQQQPAAGALAPAPGSGQQRTPSSSITTTPSASSIFISDVVTNASGSGISERAGVCWPGVPVGAGLRPRARALLVGKRQGGAAAVSDLLSAVSMPAAPLAPKRRRRNGPQPMQVDEEGQLGVRSPRSRSVSEAVMTHSPSAGMAGSPTDMDTDVLQQQRQQQPGAAAASGAGPGPGRPPVRTPSLPQQLSARESAVGSISGLQQQHAAHHAPHVARQPQQYQHPPAAGSADARQQQQQQQPSVPQATRRPPPAVATMAAAAAMPAGIADAATGNPNLLSLDLGHKHPAAVMQQAPVQVSVPIPVQLPHGSASLGPVSLGSVIGTPHALTIPHSHAQGHGHGHAHSAAGGPMGQLGARAGGPTSGSAGGPSGGGGGGSNVMAVLDLSLSADGSGAGGGGGGGQ